MMISTGEEVEVRKYKRLTELKIEVIFTISAHGTFLFGNLRKCTSQVVCISVCLVIKKRQNEPNELIVIKTLEWLRVGFPLLKY